MNVDLPIRSDLDRFAEEISKDCRDPACSDPACGKRVVTVRSVAEVMGISYDQANAYMQRLRRRYRG